MTRQIRRLTWTSPLRCRSSSARSGESSNTTVIVIVVAVVVGILVLGCLGLVVFGLVGGAVMLPAVQKAREAAERTQSMNNLKQISLAMLNYSDANQQLLPGGTYAEDGTALHSWQTLLLPYMDQMPLYQSINLDVPWNDPVNASNFYVVVPAYQHPALMQTERTTAEGYAASHYAANQNVFLPNGQLTLRDVTDGTSNTIAAGEVMAGFRAWGDPTNVRDPALGISANPQGFGGPSPGGCVFVLMDGSVRFVSENIDPDVLKALSTYNGGEPVGDF